MKGTRAEDCTLLALVDVEATSPSKKKDSDAPPVLTTLYPTTSVNISLARSSHIVIPSAHETDKYSFIILFNTNKPEFC